jgi:DNA polymerase-3 subunit alpha
MKRKNSIYHNVHCHTEYSVLDGVGRVEEYAQIALDCGMGYLCATDHGMAAAWPTLLAVCEEKGLRPVFGAEVYVNDWHHMVPKFKDLSDEEKVRVRKNNHMLLLAENQVGFENLIKLTTLGWEKGYYYKPRVSMEQIAQHAEGLVATSACLASPINQELLKGNPKAAQKIMREWASLFPGRYWIEWQMNGMEDQNRCNAN